MFEVPAYYFNDGKDGEKMTLHDAKQAASKAFEAAQIAGVTDKEKFVSDGRFNRSSHLQSIPHLSDFTQLGAALTLWFNLRFSAYA